MESDGTMHTQKSQYTHTHTRARSYTYSGIHVEMHLCRWNNGFKSSNQDWNNSFPGFFWKTGLILTLLLESQQVAVLINGAWLLSSGKFSHTLMHTLTDNYKHTCSTHTEERRKIKQKTSTGINDNFDGSACKCAQICGLIKWHAAAHSIRAAPIWNQPTQTCTRTSTSTQTWQQTNISY